LFKSVVETIKYWFGNNHQQSWGQQLPTFRLDMA